MTTNGTLKGPPVTMLSHETIHPTKELPDGIVYLHDIDPSIVVDLRYFGCDNFLGAPVDGYEANLCIMSRQAAEALARVQQHVKTDGYTLVVYDTYRPQRAVEHFVRWSQEEDAPSSTTKALFYPRLDKSKAFEQGYIARRSAHTRASTIDLTLLKLDKKLQQITPRPRQLADGFRIEFLDDGTVDMGSSFDLFDEASHTASPLIAESYHINRRYLQSAMEMQGFAGYSKEWWHFEYQNEPFPDTYFDFPIR